MIQNLLCTRVETTIPPNRYFSFAKMLSKENRENAWVVLNGISVKVPIYRLGNPFQIKWDNDLRALVCLLVL